MQARQYSVPPAQAEREGCSFMRLVPDGSDWIDFPFGDSQQAVLPLNGEGLFFLRYLHRKEELARRFRDKASFSLHLGFPLVLSQGSGGAVRLESLFLVECPCFSYPSPSDFSDGEGNELSLTIFKEEPETPLNRWLDGHMLENRLGVHEDEAASLRSALATTKSLRDFLLVLLKELFGVEGLETEGNGGILEVCYRVLRTRFAESGRSGVEVSAEGMLCDLDKGMITRQLQRDLNEMLDKELLGSVADDTPAGIFLRSGSPVERGGDFLFARPGEEPLKRSQAWARERCLASNCTVVKGPPGNGKTHLIKSLMATSLCRHVLDLASASKAEAAGNFTLLTGTNNQAVDQALLGMGLEGMLPVAVRLGNRQVLEETTLPFLQRYVRRLSTEEAEGAFDRYEACKTKLAKAREENAGERELYLFAREALHWWVVSNGGKINGLLVGIIGDLASGKGLKAFYKKTSLAWFTRVFPLAGCTLLSIRNALVLREGLIHTLLVDEAGQCLPWQVLPALYRARHAVFLGDSFQLEPITQLTAKDWENFSRAGKIGKVATEYAGFLPTEQRPVSVQSLMEETAGESLCVLKEHFRCRSPIVEVMKDLCGYEIETRLEPVPRFSSRLLAEHALWRMEARGREEASAGSWSNPVEAEAVGELLDGLFRQGFRADQIAVITPYRGQLFELGRIFRRRHIAFAPAVDREEASEGVKLGTVHRFQGGERDVVVFSAVNSRREPAFLNSRVNLLNVAVSRARFGFVFVGDSENLKRGSYTSVLWRHLQRNGGTLSLDALREGSGPSSEIFESCDGRKFNP